MAGTGLQRRAGGPELRWTPWLLAALAAAASSARLACRAWKESSGKVATWALQTRLPFGPRWDNSLALLRWSVAQKGQTDPVTLSKAG